MEDQSRAFVSRFRSVEALMMFVLIIAFGFGIGAMILLLTPSNISILSKFFLALFLLAGGVIPQVLFFLCVARSRIIIDNRLVKVFDCWGRIKTEFALSEVSSICRISARNAGLEGQTVTLKNGKKLTITSGYTRFQDLLVLLKSEIPSS